MLTYHTADFVFPISTSPIRDGVLGVDTHGVIRSVQDPASPTYTAPASAPKHHAGILLPGFINAHCHLELSHLAGKSATGKTLLPFLVDVVTMRGSDQPEIDAAIAEQDRLMWEAGIQAVGDICNKADTAGVKRRSPIRYYSFVEMFDFLQSDKAQSTFDTYFDAYAEQPGDGGNRKSAVPHAPYTVSPALFEKINTLNRNSADGRPQSVSIHNQETPAEDQLFETGKGPFINFFEGFGANLDKFTAPSTPSIYYSMDNMDPTLRTLFVHNTLTKAPAINTAQQWGKDGIYWVTCPNANLYIENRLPRYERFLDVDAKIAIGTDSLTSNWQLSILEELKTINKYQSFVPFPALLRWATLNGAEALHFDEDLGSLEIGKTPGLLQMTGLQGNGPKDFSFTCETAVTRIV